MATSHIGVVAFVGWLEVADVEFNHVMDAPSASPVSGDALQWKMQSRVQLVHL